MASKGKGSKRAVSGISTAEATQLMQESAAREVAAQVAADFDKKTKAAWLARSVADAQLYVNTEGAIREQEVARVKLALQRGAEASNPNIAPNSDEKKGILGLTPLGQFYIENWTAELMKLHHVKPGGNKPPTIRTAVSSFGAIMAAVNCGAGAKLEVQNAEGKKELIEVPQDVSAFLQSHATRWQDTVKLARDVRNAAGYKSSKGGKSDNAIQARTISTMLAKWKGRTKYETVMLIYDFLTAEVREKTQGVNQKYLNERSAEYRDSISKCMLEVNAIAVQSGVVVLGAPKQEVQEQRTGTNG